MSLKPEDLKITGEPTMDPQVCKFEVNESIHGTATTKCTSTEMANGSPLFEELFKIESISQVMVMGTSITVAKTGDIPWPEVGKQIGEAIRTAAASDKPFISPDHNKGTANEEEIRTKVQELFDTEINPALASHGGSVQLVDVNGTDISLILGGGCQGCASASATLRQGIEKAIRERVPEVGEVTDATDHATGANPYYQ